MIATTLSVKSLFKSPWVARDSRLTAFFLTVSVSAVGLTLLGPNTGGYGRAFVMVAVLALAFSGVIHGALDLWISRDAGLWADRASFMIFHAAYVALAALVVAAFIVFPVWALIAFVVGSVWHFSEDWQPALPAFLRIIGASLLVLVASASHTAEVVYLFSLMTGESAAAGSWVGEGLLIPLFWLAAGTVTAAWLFDRRSGLEIAALIMLAWLTPPIVAFAVYFGCLHSPRHLIRHHAVVASTREKLILVLYGTAAICFMFWLGTLVGTANKIEGEVGLDLWFRALFIGLAALTFPHIVLLHFAKNKGTSFAKHP